MRLEPHRLVFIDETSTTPALTVSRRYENEPLPWQRRPTQMLLHETGRSGLENFVKSVRPLSDPLAADAK
jgi:hypothetical protein